MKLEHLLLKGVAVHHHLYIIPPTNNPTGTIVVAIVVNVVAVQ